MIERERDREREEKIGQPFGDERLIEKDKFDFFSSFFLLAYIQLNIQPFTIASHYKYPPFSSSLLPLSR
jgi:hypothetical protein